MVSESTDAPLHITLVGNPNVGKSTLFNALVGANSRISNYPGITADSVIGEFFGAQQLRIVTDLPGTYSLELNLPEAQLCHQHLKFDVPPQSEQQNLIIVVIEAVGFPRNFQLLAQLMALGVPMAVVVTKTAEAQLRGYQIQLQALEESLGIPVVEAAEKSAMRTLDVEALIAAARIPTPVHPDQESIEQWSSDLLAKTSLPVRPEQARRRRRRDDRLDRVLVHPIAGSVLFLLAMICMFGSVYWMAQVPMEWIDVAFGTVGGWISTSMEDGPLRGLLVDGVIGGISGTMVFLPQILLLFFLISLLEETGYMARAAFVADRWLRPFGLPGQAFVPLLSSHACAIPGILCNPADPRSKRSARHHPGGAVPLLFGAVTGVHLDGRDPRPDQSTGRGLRIRRLLPARSFGGSGICGSGPQDPVDRTQSADGAGTTTVPLAVDRRCRSHRHRSRMDLLEECRLGDPADLYRLVVAQCLSDDARRSGDRGTSCRRRSPLRSGGVTTVAGPGAVSPSEGVCEGILRRTTGSLDRACSGPDRCRLATVGGDPGEFCCERSVRLFTQCDGGGQRRGGCSEFHRSNSSIDTR